MKKMTKKQVVNAASKIAKEATKSLDKILNENDMFFDPINKSWDEGPIDHSKDDDGNWENVVIRNKNRDSVGLFVDLVLADETMRDLQEFLYTRKELEDYIYRKRDECSPEKRIKHMQDEIKRLKEKYNIKD